MTAKRRGPTRSTARRGIAANADRRTQIREKKGFFNLVRLARAARND